MLCDVPQEETENWVRLSMVLINDGTSCVRRIVMDWLQEKTLTFDMLLDSNRRGLKNSNRLYARQKKILYPDSKRPENLIETLDLTLLLLLIGLCRMLRQPEGGWTSVNEPPPSSLDPSSDLVRIRLMRNELYHLPKCAIGKEEFEEKWKSLTEILKRLGAVDYDLYRVKSRKFIKAQCRAYARIIREQFADDRCDAEKFVNKVKENIHGKKKQLFWMDVRDQGLRQRVAYEAVGYYRAMTMKMGNTN